MGVSWRRSCCKKIVDERPGVASCATAAPSPRLSHNCTSAIRLDSSSAARRTSQSRKKKRILPPIVVGREQVAGGGGEKEETE